MITHLTQYGGTLNQLIASAVLITAILLFQLGTNQWINKRKFRSMTYRRRWTVGLRNLRLILIAVGLILIWATELRTAALSAVAILAAIRAYKSSEQFVRYKICHVQTRKSPPVAGGALY